MREDPKNSPHPPDEADHYGACRPGADKKSQHSRSITDSPWPTDRADNLDGSRSPITRSGSDQTQAGDQTAKAPVDSADIEGATFSLEEGCRAVNLARTASAAVDIAQLIQSGTWEKYEMRAAALARSHPRNCPFAAYLSRLRVDGWRSRNSRQGDRSALVRIAARDVLELMPAYWNALLRAVEPRDRRIAMIASLREKVASEIMEEVKRDNRPLDDMETLRLGRAVSFLLQVPPDPYHEAVRRKPENVQTSRTDQQESRSRHGTKAVLQTLDRHQRRRRHTEPDYDWRGRFWQAGAIPDTHLDDRRRACLAALIVTGCRPAEFAEDLGIMAQVDTQQDRPALTLRIAGAKVSTRVGEALPAKGQAERRLDLVCRTPEALWLHEYMLDQGGADRLTWTTGVVTQGGVVLSPSERHRRISVSLGKLTTRLGRIAFPRVKGNLTPYVFRHALAADLRRSGDHLPVDVASILGHASSRTQEHYGSAAGARRDPPTRATQIVGVSSSQPVRTPDRPGLAFEG